LIKKSDNYLEKHRNVAISTLRCSATWINALSYSPQKVKTARLNEGVDEVRRAEVKENAALKKTRYLWLKNRESHQQTKR